MFPHRPISCLEQKFGGITSANKIESSMFVWKYSLLKGILCKDFNQTMRLDQKFAPKIIGILSQKQAKITNPCMLVHGFAPKQVQLSPQAENILQIYINKFQSPYINAQTVQTPPDLVEHNKNSITISSSTLNGPSSPYTQSTQLSIQINHNIKNTTSKTEIGSSLVGRWESSYNYIQTISLL